MTDESDISDENIDASTVEEITDDPAPIDKTTAVNEDKTGAADEDESAILIPSPHSLYTDFWKQFRLFASPFEEWSFRYWYLVPLIWGALLLIVDINLDLRQGIDLLAVLSQAGVYYKHALSFTKYDLTATPLLFALVAFAAVSFTFDCWEKSVPALFWRLYTMGRIFSRTSRQKVSREEYLRFLAQYQQALLSWKRFVFLGVALLLTLGLMLLIVPAQIAAVVSSPAPDGFSLVLALIRWPFWLILLAGLILAYYVALGLWTMAITGWYVMKLTTQFHLVLQPHHIDHCGGLRLLGRFCLGLALPVLTASCFLGIYGFALALLTQGASVFVTLANLFLCLITILLAALAFFGPLWHIHRRMVTRKAESDEDYSLMLVLLEARLRSALHNGELEKARSAREELDLVHVLYPQKTKSPAWPFDRRLFLAYALPQLLPLLSLLVAVNTNGLFANAIKGLWTLFSGHPL